MPHYIYSTLTNAVNYVSYEPSENDLPKKSRSILINGGTGVASKHLVTPHGVVTEISDEELEILKANPTFQTHVKNGFITFQPKEVPVEVGVKGMNPRDKSSPKTPADYENTDGPKPIADKKIRK